METKDTSAKPYLLDDATTKEFDLVFTAVATGWWKIGITTVHLKQGETITVRCRNGDTIKFFYTGPK
jgi:hypothetical protein